MIAHFGFEIQLPNGMDLAVIILPEERPATGIPIARLNVNPDIPVANQELETFGWGSTTFAQAQDDFPNIPRTQECNTPTGLETSNTLLCAWAEGSAVGGGDSGMCIIYNRCHLTIHD